MAKSGLGQRARALACLVGVAVALAGCETGAGSPNGAAGADAAPVAQRGKSGTRDVEAPEVFNVTDKGLWDGRPSLGGIWVAHSSVKTPERVVVRNAANGKSIEAALFRRERSNPGPALQLSDSAAAALGMLAGQPAELTVVALRRMEVAPEPEPDAGGRRHGRSRRDRSDRRQETGPRGGCRTGRRRNGCRDQPGNQARPETRGQGRSSGGCRRSPGCRRTGQKAQMVAKARSTRSRPRSRGGNRRRRPGCREHPQQQPPPQPSRCPSSRSAPSAAR